jgi:hypothetical protein
MSVDGLVVGKDYIVDGSGFSSPGRYIGRAPGKYGVGNDVFLVVGSKKDGTPFVCRMDVGSSMINAGKNEDTLKIRGSGLFGEGFSRGFAYRDAEVMPGLNFKKLLAVHRRAGEALAA